MTSPIDPKEQLKLPDVILQVTPGGIYITAYAPTPEEEEALVKEVIDNLEKQGISCKELERGWCA